jgi:hypothetical protein
LQGGFVLSSNSHFETDTNGHPLRVSAKQHAADAVRVIFHSPLYRERMGRAICLDRYDIEFCALVGRAKPKH